MYLLNACADTECFVKGVGSGGVCVCVGGGGGGCEDQKDFFCTRIHKKTYDQ